MINNKFVLGIIGSRKRKSLKDFQRVNKLFLKFLKQYPEMIVCSGLCVPGADHSAYMLANKYNANMLWFPAKWNKYNKSAGFIRNTFIAECSDTLIALPKFDHYGGANDTIKKFIKLKGRKNLILVREYINYNKNSLI